MPRLYWTNFEGRYAWFCYALGLGVLGSLAIAWGIHPSTLLANVPGVLFFLALETLTEVLYFPLPQGGGVSVSFAIVLACNILFGPGITSLVAGLGLLLAVLIASGWVGLDRLVFNFGQIALAAFLSGTAFVVSGGGLSHSSVIANVLAALVAGACYFAVNAGLVTAGIALATGQSFRAVWTGNVKWTIPSYFALALFGLLVSMVYRSYQIVGALLLLVPLLFARYSFLLYLNARKASVSVTQALAAALEAKDAYTRGHSDRVAELAVAVARHMGLGEESIETIKYAAEMHDIGKIGVSENLLNKPGSLTPEELSEIRKHASIGADMVKKIDFLKGVSEIIRYHHEWYDGSGGYPRDRTGSGIPIGARILMVCDSYDAMTSDRPYRKSLGADEAIRRLREGAGQQFDPGILEAFLEVLEAPNRKR